MSLFNIYMCGVGGQGIGMLSEVLSRACLDAGHKITGCDTHGLAQRGGIVVSHLRLGDGARTPRVPDRSADLVIALERLEALRAADAMLTGNGTVIY
jgi:indolepyruvate ferredoxin oxidoreductase beta subunit